MCLDCLFIGASTSLPAMADPACDALELSMSFKHFPAELIDSVESLISCSSPSVTPLRRLTENKARKAVNLRSEFCGVENSV